MSKEQQDKLKYDELIKSTTMFYVNEDCEEYINTQIDRQVSDIERELKTIEDKETLKSYIISHTYALERLTSIMGLSEERFRRIVSMIRKDKGYTFQTEWSLGKIRSSMLESPAMMDCIVDLIWDGRNDPKFKVCIPSFYLENLSLIDVISVSRESDYSIRKFVKHGLEGTYSNHVGDSILEDVENVLKAACRPYNLKYLKKVKVKPLGRTVSFIVGDLKDIKLILDVSYNVTTSSAQTKKREDSRSTYQFVADARQHGSHIIYVNFLDGAGWIGRQSDLKEIYHNSDYVINLANIGLLKDIIQQNAVKWEKGE